ncbi:MAG: hypothetical protein J6V21_03600 [Alistipes sp.]|nr:hypothetical protein [Alistipes sp.]
MKRRVVAIFVSLVALASLVFAGSNGLPAMSAMPSQQREERPSISGNRPKRDYVDMKSDEGWQMDYQGRKIMVVVGNFAAHHNGTVITADSAVRYSERHIECFGNVLINRGSTYVYGDRADYNGDTNEAKVYSKIVKVVDGDATLFTYNFSFNTQTNIGYYSGGGVLISGENMLESDRGYLYSDSHEIVCVERVQMRNNDYEMKGDSVVYNTETNFAQFFTRTNIWNKNKEGEDDYLYTDRGSYDKATQLYKLTKHGYILTADQELFCDSLDYYRDSNYVVLKRNIQIDDRSQKLLIFGDWGEYWKEPGNVFITRNPSLISYDTTQSDSVFISSDSMWVYTHYPIREKIEKARRDSLEQAAKLATADTVKQEAKRELPASGGGMQPSKGSKEHKAQRDFGALKEARSKAMQDKANKMSSDAKRSPLAQNRAKSDSVAVTNKGADSVKVTQDTTAVKPLSKSELRRAMIDSLASDTTKYGMRLRAKLLKEESAEVNKAVKAAAKEMQRKREAERAVVLAERKVLYAKLLGEAKVRDAERKRIEQEIAKRIKDSLKLAKRLAVDSLKIDSLKLDSVKLDTLKLDSLKRDSVKVDSVKLDSMRVDSVKADSIKRDSVKLDSVKVDSLAKDSVAVDSLAKFDTMTVKQVKAYFKAIYDAEKAEEERIKQDSLDAKLDRIGLARQAKRVEQYRKWAIRDSIYNAKAEERAFEQLRRKLLRQERRGIYIQMADSATLAKVDSILLAEFGPLDTIVNHRLDSLIEILYPKPVASPTAIAKAEAENIDSLYREIFAYRRVKMFRKDAQSVCDSMTMTTIDSVIHLYKLPVLWNGNNQITSEVMHIITRDGAIAQADFEGKPLTASELDTAHYNQVTGKQMTALFRDNQIYRNDVNGNVQTIYYMQEDDSPEITLMAYIEAGDMTSYIENQQVVGITYRGNPTYTFYPMDKIPETQPTKLQGFKWEASRRPTQDSVFTRVIEPSQRIERRALMRPLFPINAILQQRKADYIRRREWRDRTDTLSYETIEWLESLKSF